MLQDEIMKLQTYKMFVGDDTVYINRDDVLEVLKQQPCEDAISRKAVLELIDFYDGQNQQHFTVDNLRDDVENVPSVMPKAKIRAEIVQSSWIPVSERLPETDNENSINNYNVLLWVKNKSHPEREPQIYLGKLRHNDGDDGSGNFWGTEIKPCDWTIWGWSYFNEPEVIAWMPLPEPYKAESEGTDGD